MIPTAIALALRDLLSPHARGALAKILGLTLLILVGAWFALDTLFARLALPWVDAGVDSLPAWAGFLEPLAALLGGLALAVGLALLLAPTTALVAGVFLDDVAEAIEQRDYPQDPPGRALPLVAALALSVRFLCVVLLVNAVAFALLLVPGVNLVVFVLANGYLLGREFFEFAALRFRSPENARALRRQHAGTVFLAGLVIAVWLTIPLINLTTPLFGAALMVHLHKALGGRNDGSGKRNRM